MFNVCVCFSASSCRVFDKRAYRCDNRLSHAHAHAHAQKPLLKEGQPHHERIVHVYLRARLFAVDGEAVQDRTVGTVDVLHTQRLVRRLGRQ